jgi:hypothetical protein
MMPTTFEVGDVLPRLEHTATPLLGFEGTVRVSRTGAARTSARPVATAGAST